MTAQGPGEAVANANGYTSYDVGMCLKWVRGPCWEIGSFFGSAIDAWNGAAHKHPGDRNPPKGAPMFYRGGTYGHIVISKGGGRMRSTDCTWSGHVGDEDLSWPEDAWNDDYLGWTEDLNGVMLPLDIEDDDDMPITEDDLEKIAARVNRVIGDYTSDGTQRENTDGERADERLRQIETVVRQIAKKVGV